MGAVRRIANCNFCVNRVFPRVVKFIYWHLRLRYMTREADRAEKNIVQGGAAVFVGILAYMRIPPNFWNNLSDDQFGIVQMFSIVLMAGGALLLWVGFGKKETEE